MTTQTVTCRIEMKFLHPAIVDFASQYRKNLHATFSEDVDGFNGL